MLVSGEGVDRQDVGVKKPAETPPLGDDGEREYGVIRMREVRASGIWRE